MPLTVSDILHNADLFRSAYPNWPHAEPEEAPVTTVTPAPAYRVRIYSDGSAWRKGAWILYRESFDGIAGACEAAQAQAQTGRLVRVTTGTSIKALAEFDGRTAWQ